MSLGSLGVYPAKPLQTGQQTRSRTCHSGSALPLLVELKEQDSAMLRPLLPFLLFLILHRCVSQNGPCLVSSGVKLTTKKEGLESSSLEQCWNPVIIRLPPGWGQQTPHLCVRKVGVCGRRHRRGGPCSTRQPTSG